MYLFTYFVNCLSFVYSFCAPLLGKVNLRAKGDWWQQCSLWKPPPD